MDLTFITFQLSLYLGDDYIYPVPDGWDGLGLAMAGVIKFLFSV